MSNIFGGNFANTIFLDNKLDKQHQSILIQMAKLIGFTFFIYFESKRLLGILLIVFCLSKLIHSLFYRKFGLKEEYADCLFLCRHCRCLFWKVINIIIIIIIITNSLALIIAGWKKKVTKIVIKYNNKENEPYCCILIIIRLIKFDDLAIKVEQFMIWSEEKKLLPFFNALWLS